MTRMDKIRAGDMVEAERAWRLVLAAARDPHPNLGIAVAKALVKVNLAFRKENSAEFRKLQNDVLFNLRPIIEKAWGRKIAI